MTDNLGMSVLLEDPSDLAVHLAVIAGVLAEVLDQTQPDMLQRARYSAGILARDLPLPVARRIQAALRHLNVGTFLVPEPEMDTTEPAVCPTRGGGWYSEVGDVELSQRYWNAPSTRSISLGLRLARPLR